MMHDATRAWLSQGMVLITYSTHRDAPSATVGGFNCSQVSPARHFIIFFNHWQGSAMSCLLACFHYHQRNVFFFLRRVDCVMNQSAVMFWRDGKHPPSFIGPFVMQKTTAMNNP
jgi:hypothetical protein